MEFLYRENKVFYKFVDRKKTITNVYLHGWGQNYKSLLFCEDHLLDENSLYVDFPPFGESGKNLKDWSIFTYANMIICLIEKLNISKINLIGHSFGGRVAIIVAALAKNKVKKLVLVDSAGMKPKRSLKFYVKLCKYKIKKRRGEDVSNFGSEDYKKLDSDTKKVFVNIVNANLESFLPMIKSETLIVFGEKDKETPIYMAKKLNRGIKKSKISIVKDASHFCFNDKRFVFLNILKEFVEG